MKTVIDHISVGVRDLNAAGEFYDFILSSLDISRKYEIPGQAIAFGDDYDFWINVPLDGEGYYVTFIKDHDGNKIEVVYRHG